MDSVLTGAIVALFVARSAQPNPDAVRAPDSSNTAAPSANAT